jgi:hypothetical protein
LGLAARPGGVRDRQASTIKQASSKNLINSNFEIRFAVFFSLPISDFANFAGMSSSCLLLQREQQKSIAGSLEVKIFFK